MFQTEVQHDLNYIFADLSRVLCGEWTVRRQGQKHRGQLGATAIFHARDGGVLDQGDGSEGGEKWLHSGYILKIEPTGFSDGLDMRPTGRRGVKDSCSIAKIFTDPTYWVHPSGRIILAPH